MVTTTQTNNEMGEIKSAAEQLQAALSTIPPGARPSKEIEALKAAAATMRVIPQFVIEDGKIVSLELVQPEIYRIQPSPGEALTLKEFVERAIEFANQPAKFSPRLVENWYQLSPSGQLSLPEEVVSAAEELQAALSTIARGAQTSKDLEAWKAAAATMRVIPEFVIEDGEVSTKLAQWVVPLKMLNWAHVRPEVLNQMFIVDRGAILATALLLLLDPAQEFFGLLHECGRGPSCDRERFYFRKRKYCCAEHRTNQAADYKERQKAARELKKRQPGRTLTWALARVKEVKQPGFKSQDLVRRVLERLQAKQQQPSTGRGRSR